MTVSIGRRRWWSYRVMPPVRLYLGLYYGPSFQAGSGDAVLPISWMRICRTFFSSDGFALKWLPSYSVIPPVAVSNTPNRTCMSSMSSATISHESVVRFAALSKNVRTSWGWPVVGLFLMKYPESRARTHVVLPASNGYSSLLLSNHDDPSIPWWFNLVGEFCTFVM